MIVVNSDELRVRKARRNTGAITYKRRIVKRFTSVEAANFYLRNNPRMWVESV